VDFRLCITKIASVQKTCGVDPKVLASMIYDRLSRCEPTVAPEALIEYCGRASVMVRSVAGANWEAMVLGPLHTLAAERGAATK
jgi:hypothetical protein